ncbi:ABC transporter ATP-binding protein [Bradyrhizobium sp. CCBAU 53421]|uniref:ABC transporter ATP-binding protein n=1 Tax=Bradyrhizobium sp. CCBAU 53421 TaxID=1325120 RepID=UPI00188CBE9B|nr:ABC transporter ATP-binding protein [Bradyrhizobium sp. CCBAU 53421]QOZ32798.1 ABC transporter ATP-binding protein [Bradyrhizobium sp. CCBAU 53421]
MTLLKASRVVKQYGNFTALHDAALSVATNEFHGLIGPNGSGKSTFMKCLAGAELPTGGTISFLGEDISKAPPAERARGGMSLKFQVTSILPTLSLYQNVLLALQAKSSMIDLVFSRTRVSLRERVMQLLDEFQLADRAHDAASTLSHGQQQWLEIAMALAAEPRLLLLDEPTGGMSQEERRATGRLLEPIKDRCSIVIVEHDLEFIREICDRITVMDRGRVLDTGTVEEIQASAKVQEVYLRRV